MTIKQHSGFTLYDGEYIAAGSGGFIEGQGLGLGRTLSAAGASECPLGGGPVQILTMSDRPSNVKFYGVTKVEIGFVTTNAGSATTLNVGFKLGSTQVWERTVPADTNELTHATIYLTYVTPSSARFWAEINQLDRVSGSAVYEWTAASPNRGAISEDLRDETLTFACTAEDIQGTDTVSIDFFTVQNMGWGLG